MPGAVPDTVLLFLARASAAEPGALGEVEGRERFLALPTLPAAPLAGEGDKIPPVLPRPVAVLTFLAEVVVVVPEALSAAQVAARVPPLLPHLDPAALAASASGESATTLPPGLEGVLDGSSVRRAPKSLNEVEGRKAPRPSSRPPAETMEP